MAPSKSVVVLHGCAHNPTGMDPTKEEWARIADVFSVLLVFVLFSSDQRTLQSTLVSLARTILYGVRTYVLSTHIIQ